jgi:DNA repair protein RecN (Recombination protein N)
VSLFTQYDKVKKELQQLVNEQSQMQQEKQFSEFLLQELENAHLESGEQEKIEEQIRMLSHAELIQTHLFQANQILSDDEQSAIPILKKAIKNIETISAYDTTVQSILERLHEVIVNLQDVSFDLARMADTTALNPELLESLQERLDKIYFLQQKHHLKSVDELILKTDTLKNRLLEIEDKHERISELEKQQKELFQAALSKANELSHLRSSKINAFTEKIVHTLKDLGMENSTFFIQMEKKDTELSPAGIDQVQFLFSANKGLPAEEIGKVASGGELSRLMLAVKSIITQESLLPTILFDEIDTGISGETAGKVATMMENISSFCQLITITHLPQIAAKGKKHYYVYKETVEDTTFTQIKELNGEERITEIAKMMSGEEVSISAREVAAELLHSAKNKH